MLIVAVLLILIFAGAGVAAHVLWFGVLLGVALLAVSAITGRR